MEYLAEKQQMQSSEAGACTVCLQNSKKGKYGWNRMSEEESDKRKKGSDRIKSWSLSREFKFYAE